MVNLLNSTTRKGALATAALTAVTLLFGGALALATTSFEVDAPAVYKKRCKMCHGDDATGATKAGKMMKTPDLTVAGNWKTATVEERVQQLREGAGKMPKFAGKMSGEEMRAVSIYIRDLAGVDK